MCRSEEARQAQNSRRFGLFLRVTGALMQIVSSMVGLERPLQKLEDFFKILRRLELRATMTRSFDDFQANPFGPTDATNRLGKLDRLLRGHQRVL